MLLYYILSLYVSVCVVLSCISRGTSHPKGFKCPHYSGVHNNTCQWLSFDGADSFMSGMPYVMHVTAENRLGSVVSEPYRAQTFMIGTYCVASCCVM